MLSRLLFGLGLAGTLCAAPALAQPGTPSYTADQLTTILDGKSEQPAFTADQLTAVLNPAAKPRTRSLTAGAGPVEPGAPGSGVLPDLKVQFNFNSAELTSGSKATLDELGRALQRDELRTLRFEIGGHTDAKGSDRMNEELSRKRAMAVTSYLEKGFGIDRSRLAPKGYGEKRLADPSDPISWINRRVEVRTIN